MNDTTTAVEKQFISMITARDPAARLRMASSMFDTGRVLLQSALKRQNPALDEAQLRAQVFLRLYSEDFSNTEATRIILKVPNMRLVTVG